MTDRLPVVVLLAAAAGLTFLVFRQHTEPVRRIEFSPDGKSFVTAGPDGTARVREVIDSSGRLKRMTAGELIVTRSLTPEERARYVFD